MRDCVSGCLVDMCQRAPCHSHPITFLWSVQYFHPSRSHYFHPPSLCFPAPQLAQPSPSSPPTPCLPSPHRTTGSPPTSLPPSPSTGPSAPSPLRRQQQQQQRPWHRHALASMHLWCVRGTEQRRQRRRMAAAPAPAPPAMAAVAAVAAVAAIAAVAAAARVARAGAVGRRDTRWARAETGANTEGTHTGTEALPTGAPAALVPAVASLAPALALTLARTVASAALAGGWTTSSGSRWPRAPR